MADTLDLFRTITRRQTGAAIRTLEEVVRAWPDDQWDERAHPDGPAWAVAYHTCFYLDFYYRESEDDFSPRPYARPDLHQQRNPGGDALTKEQILDYCSWLRTFLDGRITGWSADDLAADSPFPWLGMSRAESMLYDLRHAAYHAAQLNTRLKILTGTGIGWIGKDDLVPSS